MLFLENYNNFNFKKWFGDSKVVNQNGEPLLVYHGSYSYFQQFDYKFIGNLGTGEGYGFYFTNLKEKALNYATPNGYLYNAYLKIEKPLKNYTKNITKKEFREFLKYIDPHGNDYLSNFGDVNFDGYEKVLNYVSEEVYESSDDDIDLIHDIINAMGRDFYTYYRLFYNFFGFDGIIEKEKYRKNEVIYVVFFNHQIYIVDIEKIEK